MSINMTVNDFLEHVSEYNHVIISDNEEHEPLEEYDGRNSISDKYLDYKVISFRIHGDMVMLWI